MLLRTSLDERSARRRDLYLIKHNTHLRQTPLTPAEFEPTIPARELPQTQALDSEATGICKYTVLIIKSYSDIMQIISFNVNFPKYLEEIEALNEGLKMNNVIKY